MSSTAVALVALAAGLATAAPAGASGSKGSGPLPALVGHPSTLVDPLDGTGTGSVEPGTVSEYPGADVPFGMLQWSPDTSPDTAGSGGLYSYADSHITGFSLTHLSGTGCAAYGDVPVLPTVGSVGASPQDATDTFSHATEHASAGRYEVTLGPAGITTALTVNTRTGLARFTFPRSHRANLLFKVAGSANPVTAASVDVAGDEVSGEVTSGQFCETGTNYTLHFVARFNRAFDGEGTWSGGGAIDGARRCRGSSCGAFVSFDTTADRTVEMQVGISFVSTADAALNLSKESPGWSLGAAEAAATSQWNAALDRVAIGGGTRSEQRTFYTALYHSMLEPNVVSDVNGDYAGADGTTHRTRPGHAEYSNFSEWDIYRSEVPLLAVLEPRRVGDMMQSLVDFAEQNGWLPKWAIVGGDASQMNGDSADPILADAMAFGVHDFDVKSALAYMVKGATQNESGHGLEIERQYLSQYLTQHYVNAGSLDLTSINYSIGASATLEYALDDFAIARVAAAQGKSSLASTMMRRAHNWEYEFNPATGYMQARNTDGSFPPGAAFSFSELEAGGQNGFEEGNAIQYTWAVPQDLAALANLMGGDQSAVAKLDSLFTHLNASRDFPYDWAGNEPSEWTPWEYDFFGDPSGTQRTVRQIVNTLYADAPVDEPGNDDMGALSSWYVWAAIGLYPVTPGTATLAIASPLFPVVDVTLGDGHHLVLHARGASASRPYVHALHATGITRPAPSTPGARCGQSAGPTASASWDQPWLPASVIDTGGMLTFTLSSAPDASWGAAMSASPPSYGSGRLPAVGFSFPSGATSVATGSPAAVELGIRQSVAGDVSVQWSASGPGLRVTPSSGTLALDTGSPAHDGASCGGAGLATAALSVTAAGPGAHVLTVTLHDGATSLPPVVLDVTAAP